MFSGWCAKWRGLGESVSGDKWFKGHILCVSRAKRTSEVAMSWISKRRGKARLRERNRYKVNLEEKSGGQSIHQPWMSTKIAVEISTTGLKWCTDRWNGQTFFIHWAVTLKQLKRFVKWLFGGGQTKTKKKQTAQNVRELCYSSTSALLSQPLADNRGPGRVY